MNFIFGSFCLIVFVKIVINSFSLTYDDLIYYTTCDRRSILKYLGKNTGYAFVFIKAQRWLVIFPDSHF